MQPNHQQPQEFSNLCFSGISQKYSIIVKIKNINKFVILLKGTGRLCKVVKLSMQCCGQIL